MSTDKKPAPVFDYEHQVWTRNGVVEMCGHPDTMRANGHMCCSAARLAGQSIVPGTDTPITDALAATFDGEIFDPDETDAALKCARRLERDRAALIAALEAMTPKFETLLNDDAFAYGKLPLDRNSAWATVEKARNTLAAVQS